MAAAAAAATGDADGGLAQQTPEPDPAATARLVAMGFPQAAVEAALRAAFNDEEAAANRLLG
jgi:uncharacterized UBP type Zn finger protein